MQPLRPLFSLLFAVTLLGGATVFAAAQTHAPATDAATAHSSTPVAHNAHVATPDATTAHGTTPAATTAAHGAEVAETSAKTSAGVDKAAVADEAALVSTDIATTEEVAKDISTQSDPLMILITFAIGAYLFHLWLQDYRARRAGKPNPSAFPGAFPASATAIAVAIIGAVVILAAETGGEIALGISSEQSSMTVLMLLAVTAAAFFEELIFRGYLVVTQKGRAMLIGSILFFSVVFAIAHPFLWEMTTTEGVPGWQFWNADWTLNLTLKGWFSTAFVLLNSLWFYAMRFNPLNPERSLVPCITAHLVTNWGVFAIKLAQGHVSGLW